MKKRTPEESTRDTIKIIEANGRILLRKKRKVYADGSVYDPQYDTYMHHHTDIAAGWDNAKWVYRKARNVAKEFANLNLAHAIAPLYDCTVVVVYPKGKCHGPL